MRAIRGARRLFSICCFYCLGCNTEAFVLWLFTSCCVFLDLLHPGPLFMKKKLSSLLNKNGAPSLFFITLLNSSLFQILKMVTCVVERT